jgi:hypothetical protein
VATTRDVTKALATTAATSSAWTMFAKQDAAAAGLVFDAPSMSRAFPYQQDRARHVLSAGQSVTLAGLTLTAGTAAAGGQKVLTLTIANPRDTAVAYRVATTTSTGVGGCTQRVGLPHNAIVVSARSEVQRAECTWATDLQLVITAVDALEVPPLAAHYLSQISPSALALDERPAMGHQRASGGCEILAWPALTAAVAQAPLHSAILRTSTAGTAASRTSSLWITNTSSETTSGRCQRSRPRRSRGGHPRIVFATLGLRRRPVCG